MLQRLLDEVWLPPQPWRVRLTELVRVWSWESIHTRTWIGCVFAVVFTPFVAVWVFIDSASGNGELGEDLLLLLTCVVADIAAVKGLDVCLARRQRASAALEMPAFLEMVGELRLDAVDPSALRGLVGGTRQLSRPFDGTKAVLLAVYQCDFSGRKVALFTFTTGRGEIEFHTVAATRLAHDHPFATVGRSGELSWRKDRRHPALKLGGIGATALSEDLKLWVDQHTFGTDFEVQGDWLSCSTDGYLDAGIVRPMLAAVDGFADRLESN